MLIVVLVALDRNAEALSIAKQAKSELKDSDFDENVAKAIGGNREVF